jgi:hypothetical protein
MAFEIVMTLPGSNLWGLRHERNKSDFLAPLQAIAGLQRNVI